MILALGVDTVPQVITRDTERNHLPTLPGVQDDQRVDTDCTLIVSCSELGGCGFLVRACEAEA